MSDRLTYIDSVKGVGILLVIIGHIVPMNNALSVWLYSFHIPLFFIICGILHSVKNNQLSSFKELFIKKSKSLMYPYMTFSLITIIFWFLTGIIRRSFNGLLSMSVLTITFLGYSSLWFLPCYFISELTFIYIMKKSSKMNCFFCILGISIITILSSIFNLSEYMGIFSPIYYFIGRILVGLNYIFIGYSFNQLRMKLQFIKKKYLCIIGLFMILVNIFTSQLNSVVDVHYYLIGNPFLFYFNGIIGAYGMILLSECIFYKSNFLGYCGKNSIIILITHLPLPVVKIISIIIHMFSLNVYANYILIFVFCVISEVLIVFIINKYLPFLIKIDKFPIIMRCNNGTN